MRSYKERTYLDNMRKKESFWIGIIFIVLCSLLLIVIATADDWDFVQIGSLKPGDALMDKQGAEVEIKSIEQVKDKNGVTVYDLAIEDYNYYFADSVLVHNSGGVIPNLELLTVPQNGKITSDTDTKLIQALNSLGYVTSGDNADKTVQTTITLKFGTAVAYAGTIGTITIA